MPRPAGNQIDEGGWVQRRCLADLAGFRNRRQAAVVSIRPKARTKTDRVMRLDLRRHDPLNS
jgi:hypothetical protein